MWIDPVMPPCALCSVCVFDAVLIGMRLLLWGRRGEGELVGASTECRRGVRYHLWRRAAPAVDSTAWDARSLASLPWRGARERPRRRWTAARASSPYCISYFCVMLNTGLLHK